MSENEEEVWKPVVDANPYDISNLGRVRSYWRVVWPKGQKSYKVVRRDLPPKIKNPQMSIHGYHILMLYSDASRDAAGRALKFNKKIHHMVLEAFVGQRPSGCECRHLNGVRTDNRLCNLAWGTAQENADDRVAQKTVLVGSDHPNAKLSQSQVSEIRELVRSGSTHTAASKKYGISRQQVGRIVSGARWRDGSR